MATAQSLVRQQCWEPNKNSQFATVVAQNKINIYNVQDAELASTLSLPLQLSTIYNCIQWCEASDSVKQQEPKKKKAKTTATTNNTSSSYTLVLAGTSSGKLFVWHPERNECLTQASIPSSKPILGLALLKQEVLVATSNQLYALANYKNAAVKALPTKLASPSTTIASSATGKYVAVGSVSGPTYLLDGVSKQVHLQLQGHGAETVALCFLHDDYLVSASQDRFVHIFDLNSDNNDDDDMSIVAPTQVVTCDSQPTRLQLVKRNDKLCLLVTTDAGNCFVWQFDKLGQKNPKPTRKIQVTKNKITSATFKDQDTVQLVVGSLLQPTFLTCQPFAANTEQITLEAAASSNIAAAAAALTKTRQQPDASEAHVSGPATSATPMARFKQVASKQQQQANTAATVQDKIKEFDVNAYFDEMKKAQGVPQMQFSTSLLQALQSVDKTLLDACLTQSDRELVELTIKKLPSVFVLPLLQAILDRYQNYTVSNHHLIYWIRALLVNHTSFIMSQQNIVQALSPFYHAIQHRLTVFPKLMDVTGRLDLLLSVAGHVPSKLTTPIGNNSLFMDASDDEADTQKKATTTPKKSATLINQKSATPIVEEMVKQTRLEEQMILAQGDNNSDDSASDGGNDDDMAGDLFAGMSKEDGSDMDEEEMELERKLDSFARKEGMMKNAAEAGFDDAEENDGNNDDSEDENEQPEEGDDDDNDAKGGARNNFFNGGAQILDDDEDMPDDDQDDDDGLL